MIKTSLFTLIAITSACSGGSSKPSTAPTTPPADPVPMTELAVSTNEPAKPSEPRKPTEPPAPDPAVTVNPPGKPGGGKADLLAAETAAYEKAKPVFDKYCAKCHTKTGSKTSQKKRDHFDMTTYPFGGHHAMEIGIQIRKSLGIDGSKPTMPFDKKGAVKGDELALIKAWTEAFDASHKGGAHEGHGEHGGHKH